MKIVLTLTAFLFSASVLLAQAASEAQKPAQAKPLAAPERKGEQQSQDSPLVRAAKANKANATKGKPRVVISDKDVKNSTGKLIYVTEAPLPKLPPAPAAARPATTDQNPQVLAAQAEQRLRAAEKEVKSLEMELSRLENDYYEEDDSAYRDDVIEARFSQATRQLTEARQKLLNAREEHNRWAASAATRNPSP